jgi:acetyltransferase-like isoleucine patch superfamily enzyme
VLYKVRKWVLKPHIVLWIVCKRLRLGLRVLLIRVMSQVRGIDLELGGKVEFFQKTIITGKGSITIGGCTSFGFRKGGYYCRGVCELQPRYEGARITIGSNVHTNNNLFICSAGEVRIGDNTLIGEGVMMIDHDAHGIRPDERNKSIGNIRPIVVGENVWIGSRVTILPGTEIGRNSIVGAGAVVKGVFPENVIIAGNPGKVIKGIEAL